MKKYRWEIAKLTAGEVLATIFDAAVVPFFQTSSVYRASANQYLHEREEEKMSLSQKIYYLKRHGLIDSFVEGKEKYFELTPKGIERLNHDKLFGLRINRQEKWDGKWRFVIFDVPNDRADKRDVFRNRITNIGFKQIQESVYVFPFECTAEIDRLSHSLFIEHNVLILIADIMQGERKVIEHFLSNNILTEDDLRN